MAYHFSEISTWLKCQQLHKYNYRDYLTMRQEDSRISFGTFGHEVLGRLLIGDTKDEAKEFLIAKIGDAPDETKDVADEAFVVACRAFDFLSNRFETVDYLGKPLVEVPLTTSVSYQGVNLDFIGTPDWIARDKFDGGVWVFDHKFRKTFRPNWAEDLNLQMVFYQYMLRHQYGIETVGTRQFQIKPTAPRKPEMTTKGKMSVADLLTTWEVYAVTCKERGLNPDDYAEVMRPKLDTKVFFDFDSNRAYRSPEEVDRMWEQVILPAALQIHQQSTPLRCFNYANCQMCSYREYCVEDMKGGDLVFLQKTRYKKKGESSYFDVEMVDDDQDNEG